MALIPHHDIRQYYEEEEEPEILPAVNLDENHFTEINCKRQQLTVKNLKNVWCNHVSHYFDWVSGVPELRLMDERGRVKLVTRQLPRIVFLMLSFWTFQHGYDGLVLGNGIFFNSRKRHTELAEKMVLAATNFIQTHVIPTFRRTRMTRAEYLLLKAIALFEALDVYFPPADRLIMENALSKYRSALVNHMRSTRPELDHEAVIERVQALLGTLTYLEALMEYGNEIMTDVILGNNGDMHGRLTIEIHMNSVREL
ncbi:Ligand-binding domain of nuclear hormone receptor [Ancylostoma ceylanicum]|uniref:Ligand-binding domain of nuclear hormone receptor n=1 Tax=Ancylostoma ceylanicum TaxID=53326 RepID=A0A0D6LUM8_9BILA|nr:Ligand-binding domain of nuclear hormone receptor [Ancylostoma ceylanicum]